MKALKLFALLALLPAMVWACELEVDTAGKPLKIEVNNMRHGTHNELTLFLTLKNEGKAVYAFNGAESLYVVDEQGRREKPASVDAAPQSIAPGGAIAIRAHYTPSPDYTAATLKVD
ncbi:hypothetical protein SAMN02745857_02690 [Andreprevotia lacus DSM 23236]|jgi:uncharacterized ParB-like nuclease family protein|uniref:Intracellular proteinase inhibitor n=1 Tax=Andreprevotia lacus DSM 23236 TaxID=1121001 RepID=A0A1W1XSX0_9NEIS|nr:hypothetical protein [Andreprevotia lacus]SMC27053.1 hypothetical protein SAMN02745857_02690 [Andreprevotia lacus DSM 23236]